jgi:hypothetical protein
VHTFYFDRKDGVPVRDNRGQQFRLNSEAIEHSKALAEQVRNEGPVDPNLTIVVLDETGREIHREPVMPRSRDQQP